MERIKHTAEDKLKTTTVTENWGHRKPRELTAETSSTEGGTAARMLPTQGEQTETKGRCRTAWSKATRLQEKGGDKYGLR